MRLPVFIYTIRVPAITFYIRLAEVKAGILSRQMLMLVTFIETVLVVRGWSEEE